MSIVLTNFKFVLSFLTERNMTIEQVEELRKQEMSQTLRMPNLEITEDKLQKALNIRWAIFGVLNSESFSNKLITKSILRKLGVKISGKGTVKKKYILKTPFGEGKCFDIKYIFKDNKCPLEVGKCFSNSFNLAAAFSQMPKVQVADCVSGILYADDADGKRSVLHSVFELGEFVVDANFGLCVSKDLYYKIFLFEELTRISGTCINEVEKILQTEDSRELSKQFNLKTYHLVFALKDFVDFITNEQRRNEHEIFEELEYRK